MKKNPETQEQRTVRERNGQLLLTLNNEILLPENAPVRLTSAQFEELDYRKLYSAYSAKGRKSKVNPRVLFKVMVYGYQCGIYTSRKLEEACRYRVDFIWLLEENSAPDHAAFACRIVGTIVMPCISRSNCSCVIAMASSWVRGQRKRPQKAFCIRADIRLLQK